MSDIILSGAVRGNLLSLQSTTELMARTQNRLATGKKVNTALDNPNSFFTAKSLSNRANDLGTLLDSIGQAIQTIKAADQGVTAITKLVEAAKAKANQALQTADTFARSSYLAEYNQLLSQIQDLAQDSGYNGKNLLGGTGNDLSVYFNEDNSNYLVISPVNLIDTASSLGLPPLTELAQGTLAVALDDGTNPLTLSSTLVSDTTNFDVGGNTLTFTDGNSNVIGSIDVTPSMTVGDLVAEINRTFNTVRASFSAGTLTIESTESLTIDGGATGGAYDGGALTATSSTWQSDSGINATVTNLNDALDTLRAMSSTFGTNLTVVQNRQNFTKNFINTLSEGSDMLTLADTNEEGANLLALQTRQQLSSTALSLAAQSDQSVLRLFGG
ncbi:MAG: flagellin [Alphaproteobacteria bacterium]